MLFPREIVLNRLSVGDFFVLVKVMEKIYFTAMMLGMWPVSHMPVLRILDLTLILLLSLLLRKVTTKYKIFS